MQMKSTNPNTPLFLLLLLVLNGSHAFITPSVPKSRPSWSTISGLPKEPMSLLKTYPPAFGGHHRQSPSRLMARGLSYEDLMEKLPSQGVIDAIEKSKDGSVIASDLAASAGISLSQARNDLTTVASLSQGDIAVTTDGELLYRFPKNLNSVIASNSAKFKTQQAVRKAWPLIFYGIRVSFGVVLLTSLFAIFSTILFVSSSGMSDDRDDRRDDGRGGFGGRGRGSFGFGGGLWGPSPFDFFYYRPYYGYYYEPMKDPDEMGFLESVFSYVFGDGNPNVNLEEKRLQLASQMIRNNNGAVTAEQLAVYCDVEQDPNFDGIVDESYVLPVVTALGGQPRVTEEGDIVYVFPELQVTTTTSALPSVDRKANERKLLRKVGLSPDASSGDINMLLRMNGISTRSALERADLLDLLARAAGMDEEEPSVDVDDPSVLVEREYTFSLAPDLNKILSGGLGVINLGGALYLGNLLSKASLYGVRLPSYFGLVQSFYPALLLYAILFNVIPLVRNFWQEGQNKAIRERNSKRRQFRTLLQSGGSQIQRKLTAAKRLGTRLRQLRASGKDIVFDTQQGVDETERQRQEQALDEFDKLLGN